MKADNWVEKISDIKIKYNLEQLSMELIEMPEEIFTRIMIKKDGTFGMRDMFDFKNPGITDEEFNFIIGQVPDMVSLLEQVLNEKQ